MENLPIVHVVNGRQKKLLQGHPWVYGNEIERVEGEIEDGGLVTVSYTHLDVYKRQACSLPKA